MNPKVGKFRRLPPTPDEPRNYGGIYTQKKILKEAVQYAKERF